MRRQQKMFKPYPHRNKPQLEPIKASFVKSKYTGKEKLFPFLQSQIINTQIFRLATQFSNRFKFTKCYE